MQITCLGAAGCVTGSCFLVDNGHKYLVDCGLFQGGKHMEEMNRQPWGFDPGDISALFLTHAHIDHSGRIPKLVRDGFRGKIYTTLPSAELCKILLLDSAHIQEAEAEWQSRKNRRRGEPEIEPLYVEADAEACFPLFEVIANNQVVNVDSHLKVRFRNAGHILGSSILEFWSESPASPCKVVFSGDLGQKDQLIVPDPYSIFDADALFIESTYGNRNHRSFEESKNELLGAIHYSYQQNEKVLIPAFAVERTQEILYVLGEFFRDKLIPSMPVYLDSPLAIAATEIFRQMKTFYDEDAIAIVNEGHDPFDFPQLVLSRTSDDSIAINQTRGPAIVVAGNGMCTAGRIKHHLKHNLWRQGASLVVVGFQANGSIGRRIIEGAKSVKIFGEKVVVRAKVFTIGGFSAHAGQSDLLNWIGHFRNPAMQVYVTHGERNVSGEFAELVNERFQLSTYVPEIGDSILITPGALKVAEKADRSKWQLDVAKLVETAEAIRKFREESPEAMPVEAVQDVEEELSRAQERLAEILRQARTKKK
ncbi:MAG: MBL fold metallo-hydrolase [Desulfoferrobacter sp.]